MLNNTGEDKLNIYLESAYLEPTEPSVGPITELEIPSGESINFEEKLSTVQDFDTNTCTNEENNPCKFVFQYDNANEVVSNISGGFLELIYRPGTTQPSSQPSPQASPQASQPTVGTCVTKDIDACSAQGASDSDDACPENCTFTEGTSTCNTSDQDVCTAAETEDACTNELCSWNADSSTCTTIEVTECSGLNQGDCESNDSCTFTVETTNTCTTTPNASCPTGDNVSLTDCPSGDDDPCTFTASSSTPSTTSSTSTTSTCVNFDCSNHVNDISDNPSIINCSGSSCTANDCCTKPPPTTCENFNCLPLQKKKIQAK